MTYNAVAIPALCLTLAACTPMPDAEPAGWPIAPELGAENYMIKDAAALGLTGAELLPEAGAAMQAALGSTDPVEGNYTETLNVYEANGRGAAILTLQGLADDSVKAEQHVVEFMLRPDPQVEGRVFAMPEAYGVRQKCYRAADPEAWTNQPCP